MHDIWKTYISESWLILRHILSCYWCILMNDTSTNKTNKFWLIWTEYNLEMNKHDLLFYARVIIMRMKQVYLDLILLFEVCLELNRLKILFSFYNTVTYISIMSLILKTSKWFVTFDSSFIHSFLLSDKNDRIYCWRMNWCLK